MSVSAMPGAPAPAIDPLLRFRPQFPILGRSTYLVSNSLGAMPEATRQRLADYAAIWDDIGVKAWAKEWWTMPVRVGDGLAPLMGAPAGSVAMIPNVSIAQASILSAIPFAPGRDEIIMSGLDFPSTRYVTEQLGPRFGARVTVVPPSADGLSLDEERLIAAITDRTALVAISHVLFRSAYIVDAAPVIARAKQVGALVALDAYHSVGVMPVDVTALGCDFLTGGVLKWLCGGPGGSFLYVAPDVSTRLAPSFTGWQAHRAPFAFADEMDYADGAWRWLSGTPPVPALYAAIEGPRIIAEAGLGAIREKSMRQTARLIALADARGYRVHAPRNATRRGGTVAFDVPHGYEVAQALLARDIVIDYREGAGIRVAPHFYTSDDELERAVAAIDEILATGEWQRFAGRRQTVT